MTTARHGRMTTTVRVFGAAALLAVACGGSGNNGTPAADGGAGGRGGSVSSSGGSNRGGSSTGGSSGGKDSACETLKKCCVTVTSEAVTCAAVANNGDDSICDLALSKYALECPEVANEGESGTTADGWKYYPVWTSTTYFGFQQRLSSLHGLWVTATGTLLGASSLASWRSSNQGALWDKTVDGLGIRVGATLASGEIFGVNDGALFKSTDDGKSFLPLNREEGVDAYQVFQREGVLRLSDAEGLWLSKDAGQSFEAGPGVPFRSSSSIFVDRYGSWFVAADDAVYRQRAGDTRWSQAYQGSSLKEFLELPNGTLFVSAYDGVARSSDFGDTWTKLAQFAHSARLATTSKGVLFAEYDGKLLKSLDAGDTFTDAGPAGADPIEHLVILPTDQVLALGTSTAYLSPAITETPSAKDPAELPSTCFDGTLSGNETELDCGGDCGACVKWERVNTWNDADYTAPDGTAYYRTNDDAGSMVANRRELDGKITKLGALVKVLGANGTTLVGYDFGAARLAASTNRGETFTPFGPASLPGEVHALIASQKRGKVFLAIAGAAYSFPIDGDTLSEAVPLEGASAVGDFLETADGSLYVGGYISGRLYRANEAATAFTSLTGTCYSFTAAPDGTIFASGADGLYRLEGDALTKVASVTDLTGNSVAVDSNSRLFYRTERGIFSLDTKASSAEPRFEIKGGGSPVLLTGDRIYAAPYVSTPTTLW